MNEQQLVALVKRVGESLEPDVARLVAVGAARGRARRTRRRLAAVLGGAGVVVAAVALAPLVAVGGPGLPGPAAPPRETPRGLGVTSGGMGATLAALLPGARVVAGEEQSQLDVQRGAVRWRGVTVTVSIDTREAGTPLPARARCDAFAGDRYCAAAPDGAWVHTGGTIALDTHTGEMGALVNDIRVFVPGGYLLEVSAPSRSAVDREMLRDVALDDVWWR